MDHVEDKVSGIADLSARKAEGLIVNLIESFERLNRSTVSPTAVYFGATAGMRLLK